ncbi:MAG: hypothetical protein NC201_03250 [Prevotella sp.]|nr:hypothetical protein [Bacteroides sp.]MCM1366244.1 hypothetical protein [Prevotella sp.]MCM1436351.1 hypothetical protein [Prevotella sp.]
MWKTVSKWLILTILTAYIVLAASWSCSQAKAGKCSGIEVAITSTAQVDTITSRGVIKELAKYDSHIIGKNISELKTSAIEKYLNSLRNFEDVQCVITSQGKLRIYVTPMVPELRVFDGNRSYYINKEGKQIIAKADFFADVPVVSGHFTKEFPAKDILPVARFVENDPVLRELVTMIEAHDKNNIILIPRIKGHVINIGDTTNLSYKKQNIITAYKKILPYRGWETYDTISVKYHGQIVATRRDKTPLFRTTTIVDETDPEEATLNGLEETDAQSATGQHISAATQSNSPTENQNKTVKKSQTND